MKSHKTLLQSILCTALVLFSIMPLHGQTTGNEASAVTVDENTLKSYVGRYDYTRGAVLIVTLEDKQLQAQMTGQPKFPIFPSSKNEFFWRVVDASIKFITDEKGNVTGAIHSQNGSQLEVKKLKDEKPVAVNPAIFDKYVGKFNVDVNTAAVITKEGDKLIATGSNLPPYQLLPASETEFFVMEVNARLWFKVHGDKADTVLIDMGGDKITAVRVKE
jgi:hypothetical protein